jgi:hypothetical protein
MKAKFPGECVICEERFSPDEEITRFGNRWAHTPCGQYEMNQRAVQSGTTYASQRKSDYHRKIKRD